MHVLLFLLFIDGEFKIYDYPEYSFDSREECEETAHRKEVWRSYQDATSGTTIHPVCIPMEVYYDEFQNNEEEGI